MADTKYTVARPAGPWSVGQELTDDELKAHPFHEKFLRTGSVVKGALAADTAPASVAYDIDAQNPPSQKEADENRAAGKEVIQPGPGGVVVGEVVPGEGSDGKSKK